MTRSRLLITTLLAQLAGCAGAPPYDDAALPPVPAGEVWFLANASPVDFDDLAAIPAGGAALEGCFDAAYDLAEAERVLRAGFAAGGAFTPEAEWAVEFEAPLEPDAALDPLRTRLRFVPFLEGKWIDRLAGDPGAPRCSWQPASTGNNFTTRALDARALPGGGTFRSAAEWEARWRDAAQAQADDACIAVVEHTLEQGRGILVFESPFGETRTALLEERIDLAALATAVHQRFAAAAAPGARLAGIDLGLHSTTGGLVNCADHRRGALLVTALGVLNPLRFGAPDFATRACRRVAASIRDSGDAATTFTPLALRARRAP